MNLALKIVAGIAVAYAAILLLVVWFQPRLVYFPQKGYGGITPRAQGLAYEATRIRTSDGEDLAAWWIPAPSEAPALGTVLLFHGNAGTIAHRIDYAKMFHALGYHTLLVDYRGYGESTGTPSEAGTYHDAAACWQWLTTMRGVKASQIVIFGESLGGGVATWLAAQQTPRALILASTFTSIPDLGAQVYRWLPVRWISRIQYNNHANLEKIRVPVLIAHSPHDELIPYAHGRGLFEAAREPKVFLELGGGHNEGFVFARVEWISAVQAFLRRHAADMQ